MAPPARRWKSAGRRPALHFNRNPRDNLWLFAGTWQSGISDLRSQILQDSPEFHKQSQRRELKCKATSSGNPNPTSRQSEPNAPALTRQSEPNARSQIQTQRPASPRVAEGPEGGPEPARSARSDGVIIAIRPDGDHTTSRTTIDFRGPSRPARGRPPSLGTAKSAERTPDRPGKLPKWVDSWSKRGRNRPELAENCPGNRGLHDKVSGSGSSGQERMIPGCPILGRH